MLRSDAIGGISVYYTRKSFAAMIDECLRLSGALEQDLAYQHRKSTAGGSEENTRRPHEN
jgi:hypothetical protein